jgi:hypothetical protein
MMGNGWRLAASRLSEAKVPGGGYSSVPGGEAEPEPSALAAIALDDEEARAWLAGAQRGDGSFGLVAGTVQSDDTALASLALPEGPELEGALDHVTSVSGANAVGDPGAPPYGWAWTIGAHGWTEPTAWGVLALRRRRPTARDRIRDGLDLLRTQECESGGWNYGTAESFGVRQPDFAQTTAVALFAVRGADPGLAQRGLAALRKRWRHEASGPLSLAVSTAALRAFDDDERLIAASRLEATLEGGGDLDTVSLAWAALAFGPGLRSLLVR